METPPKDTPAGACERCGDPKAETRRQNTAYHDDQLNWACYCAKCQEEADAYWDEMWKEFNSSRL